MLQRKLLVSLLGHYLDSNRLMCCGNTCIAYFNFCCVSGLSSWGCMFNHNFWLTAKILNLFYVDCIMANTAESHEVINWWCAQLNDVKWLFIYEKVNRNSTFQFLSKNQIKKSNERSPTLVNIWSLFQLCYIRFMTCVKRVHYPMEI